jgi:hypothetical protein
MHTRLKATRVSAITVAKLNAVDFASKRVAARADVATLLLCCARFRM